VIDPKPRISVVLPTWNRRPLLAGTLAALRAQTLPPEDFEVLAVDNRSDDGTAEVLGDAAAEWAPLRPVLCPRPMTLGEAHNLGVDYARAPIVLFLNDDARAHPDLLDRHLVHHARLPEKTAALRGGVIESRALQLSPFMRWLERSAIRFGRPAVDGPGPLGPEMFLTINVSLKRSLLIDSGGFDTVFEAGCEDTELGVRLIALGMTLAYDGSAVVEHHHPTDLEATVRQLRGYGFAAQRLIRLHPEVDRPSPPSARHRLKAAGLLALNRAGMRPRAVREETWRFLCHQSFREGLWEGEADRPEPRIGARLFRAAAADPQVARPLDPEADPESEAGEPRPARTG